MEQLKAMLSLCLIFGMAFCLGSVVGHTVRVRDQAVMARPAQKDWGLSFQEDNKPPVADEIWSSWRNMMRLCGEYDGKVLYLTFDCGYENGNTPAILDALKKHHVPAAFYCRELSGKNPDLVKRMRAEGHIIGNHSYHHPDMSQMGKEEFQKELAQLEDLYEQTTSEKMSKFYRPPQGKYSDNNLQLARELGYRTISGALPMWTGSRRNSRPTKRRCQSC